MRARSFKYRVQRTLFLAVILCVLFPLLTRNSQTDPAIRQPEVVTVVNDVTVKEAEVDDWAAAEVGCLLYPDDQVKTGYESKAEVETHPGIIRLYQNALLIVPELETDAKKSGFLNFLLTKGAGIFRFNYTKDGPEPSVTTNQISLTTKGTTFSVILEGKELYEQEVMRAIRSFTAMDISGAVIVERWIDPVDGTVYSLMKLDRELVDRHLEELDLSKPSKIYVRRIFTNATFRLETE